jgi:diguanylate cyclase (GGDEF)-like protein
MRNRAKLFNLHSISGQLLLYFSLFLALLVGLSIFSMQRLLSVETVVEAVNQKWLVGSKILGAISEQLAEFHSTETIRLTSNDALQIKQGDLVSFEDRRAIEQMSANYLALGIEGAEIRKFEIFEGRWKRYALAHNTMVLTTDAGVSRSLDFFRPLQQFYAETQRALVAVTDLHSAAAAEEGRSIEGAIEFSLWVLSTGSGLGFLVAGWLAFVIRNRISKPLSAITASLTALSLGNRDAAISTVTVYRADELGELSKAFDIFRENVFALEKAHQIAEVAQHEALLLARHDPLTGLPNRRVFYEELEKAVARSDGGVTHAVLLVDLDRFKPVNDIHGHPVGDVVLGEIADRLREVIGKNGVVARLGGDEFAILFECEDADCVTTGEVIRFASRAIAAIEKPITVASGLLDIGSSIGIAICPADGKDAETLLRAADIAMYRAKRDGSGNFRFFEQSMDAELRSRAVLQAEVRYAVANGEIHPHYQPIVELPRGRLIGFEILSRWHHPARGLLSPDQFIPLIEELGLSSEFTYSILRRACLEAKTWPSEISLALNVSPNQLRDTLLPVHILSILTQTNFAPHRLEIEITETALVSDLAAAKAILAGLQVLGIKIALDDFGTGYSSLYHLRELRFDKIKIDRSFIQAMGIDVETTEIVNAIVGLTKNLKLPTVAEGIEDLETLRRVVESGCEFGQGYYFGKAMTADDAAALASSSLGAIRQVAA